MLKRVLVFIFSFSVFGCSSPDLLKALSGKSGNTSDEDPGNETLQSQLNVGPDPAYACSPGTSEVVVSSIADLQSAMQSAQPGRVIKIAPGTYSMPNKLSTPVAGTQAAPITVCANRLGEVTLETTNAEPFFVQHPYWRFENLQMKGVCAADSDCEHAFHIVGNADGSVFKNNRLHDYNAAFKSNGDLNQASRPFPDYVRIENNEVRNFRPRNTSNPVNGINLDGGDHWEVRRNFVADLSKNGGNFISYGMFFKADVMDSIMEKNLVVCALNVPNASEARIGMSFGGGGSGNPSICTRTTACPPETTNGSMHNNIVLNCSDVGIYLNHAANSRISHNTLVNTTGIDVRFSTSTATIGSNLIDGQIRNRDGGSHTAIANLVSASLESFFIAPLTGNLALSAGVGAIVGQAQNTAQTQISDDFCGFARDSNPDIGAIEYDATNPCSSKIFHFFETL